MAHRIKLKSLAFDPDNKFRKFKDLTIPFAERLTLICGHNGTGKSTILGVIASLSGMHVSPVPTYAGKQFEANISEIIYIDYPGEGQHIKSYPTVTYDVDGKDRQKKCAITKPRRGLVGRARSVPRSSDKVEVGATDLDFGDAQKVPLPTIYLGMSRMIPLGEVTDGRIVNVPKQEFEPEDIDYLNDFTNSVIKTFGATPGKVRSNLVKATSKYSTVPEHPYHSRSVSLGQDSLGAIANALSSFRRLKRKMKADYPGGLLIIDEMDAGFHPHAIGALVKALRTRADELELQIVATTHSPRLIEAIHPDGRSAAKEQKKDGVVYLKGTQIPKYNAGMNLKEILDEMDLVPPQAEKPRPDIRVYFEDDEACEVFNIVIPPAVIAEIEAEHFVKIRPMPLGVGCSSLALLPSKDDYFTSVILVADADGERPKKPPVNLVDLPGEVGANGKPLSPERTLIGYIRSLIDEEEKHVSAWSSNYLKKTSPENLEANLLEGIDVTIGRKPAKTWWHNKRDLLKRWGLYELWCIENKTKVDQFRIAFKAAVPVALKAQGALRYKHFQRSAL